MHEPAPMRVVERIGQFGGVTEYVSRRQRPAHEPIRQRQAFEILHDEKADVVVLADVVEVADVRMVQRAATARASRSNRRRRSWSSANFSGRTLTATIRSSRVSRAW